MAISLLSGVPGRVSSFSHRVEKFLGHTFSKDLDGVQNSCYLVSAIGNFFIESTRKILDSDLFSAGLKGRVKILTFLFQPLENLGSLCLELKDLAAAADGMNAFSSTRKFFKFAFCNDEKTLQERIGEVSRERLGLETTIRRIQPQMEITRRNRLSRNIKIPEQPGVDLRKLKAEWIKTDAQLSLLERELEIEEIGRHNSPCVWRVHRFFMDSLDLVVKACLPVQQLSEIAEVLVNYRVVQLTVRSARLLGRLSFISAVGLVAPSLIKSCVLWYQHSSDSDLQGEDGNIYTGINAYLKRKELAGTPDAHPFWTIAKEVSSLALMFFAAYIAPFALASLILGNAVVKLVRWIQKNPIEESRGDDVGEVDIDVD